MSRLPSQLHRSLVLGLFVFSVLIFFGPNAYSAQITLAWDSSSGADGYRLFYRQDGQSYNYSSPAWEGSETTCAVYLDCNTTYHFVVRAYNGHGESGNSKEVSFTVGSPPPTVILDYIEVEGPLNINENTDADYNCRAYYTDGTSLLVEPDTWDVDCSYAWISSTGLLTTYDIDSDQACRITVSYTEGAINNVDTHNVTLRDSSTPPPTDVIPQTGWSLWYVDSEELVDEFAPATYAFDGNPGTFWHTEWFLQASPLPHEIQIDLGQMYELSGFRYLPRTDGNQNGRIARYEFYVSDDGADWGAPVASGGFLNTMTEQEVLFGAVVTGQHIRLVALREVNGKPITSVAELNMLGVAPLPEVIIENGRLGTSWTGRWQLSAGGNYYGSQSVYSIREASATYTFTASVSDYQKVYMWWTWYSGFSNRCSNVQVDIFDGNTLLDTVYVEQQDQSLGGIWNLLGTYFFSGTARVVIHGQGSGCSTCADAVRFVQFPL